MKPVYVSVTFELQPQQQGEPLLAAAAVTNLIRVGDTLVRSGGTGEELRYKVKNTTVTEAKER